MKPFFLYVSVSTFLFLLSCNPCRNAVCLNGGTCVDGGCECPEGYFGDNCESNVCDDVVCLNGGACVDGSCECLEGFFGDNCESNVCDDVVCLNGGSCVEGSCECPAGFSGENCEMVEFAVVDIFKSSQSSVAFAAGQTVFFSATFTHEVNWVINISGFESGAIKRIEGMGVEINASNATWSGGTDELPLFNKEICLVELLILEEPEDSASIAVEILSPKIYEGKVITDFEADPGASLFLGNFEFELTGNTGIQDDITAGQGDQYYFFEGADNMVPNNFTGLIRIFPSATGDTYFQLPTTVPESAYFNFLLWGAGTPNTEAVIQLFHDTNGDGVFTDGVDSSFDLGTYLVDHTGWKVISTPMSTTGMSQTQLSQMVGVQIVMLHGVQGGAEQIRFGIDYLIFTAGGPLEL